MVLNIVYLQKQNASIDLHVWLLVRIMMCGSPPEISLIKTSPFMAERVGLRGRGTTAHHDTSNHTCRSIDLYAFVFEDTLYSYIQHHRDHQVTIGQIMQRSQIRSGHRNRWSVWSLVALTFDLTPVYLNVYKQTNVMHCYYGYQGYHGY